MSFEPKKYRQILEEMQQRALPGITDFEVGSVARTMFEAFSYEMALLYQKMNWVYLSGFVDTAESSQLDQVVAILGIKRGLPDFASGEVTFIRDLGENEIAVPLGTLVATEESEESPKKVYQTLQRIVLGKDQGEATVRVQAVERGNEQVTEAETVVVMPRPIPGIKEVVNAARIEFLGKRRETDEALRERAKNTLLSSGKASKIAIENAVIGLPDVFDVVVVDGNDEMLGENTIPPGVFEIYVNIGGFDKLNEEEQRDKLNEIKAKVDEARAAGVYYDRIRAAEKIRIQLLTMVVEQDPNISLTNDEKQELQQLINRTVAQTVNNLKIGEALFFSKLFKEVLLIDGVVNLDLDQFLMEIIQANGAVESKNYVDQKISVSDFEGIALEDDAISITLV